MLKKKNLIRNREREKGFRKNLFTFLHISTSNLKEKKFFFSL